MIKYFSLDKELCGKLKLKILIVEVSFNNKDAQSMLIITMDEQKRMSDCEFFWEFR